MSLKDYIYRILKIIYIPPNEVHIASGRSMRQKKNFISGATCLNWVILHQYR